MTILPNVINPINESGGNKLNEVCKESFRAPSSSSSRHVSITNKKIGGRHCDLYKKISVDKDKFTQI